MPTPILMPALSPTMEEGTLAKWNIKEGDKVSSGDVIAEIETDKATMEVEAADAGRLAKIIVTEGQTVDVKTPVAYLAESDDDVQAYLAQQGGAQTAAAPQQVDAMYTPSPFAPPTLPEGVTSILMPQAGQTMEEGTLLSWKVKEGDRIEVGQIIFEIETDKATMEVEAVDAGRLAKIVVNEGQTVDVKVPVAYLAEDDGAVAKYLAALAAVESSAAPQSAAQQAVSATAFQATQAAAAVTETGRVKASPAARKIAAQRGIDLAAVPSGSGPGGRILSVDVEGAKAPAGSGIRRPLSKMRRAIAGNLLYSKQNIPHFYAKLTVDAQALFNTYKQTKEKFQCSVNDFVTRACAKAIEQYPAFRSRFQDKEIIELPDVNIGIAVGTDEGLTVPVVLKADKMSLKELAEKTRQVVAAAREGKLEGVGQGIFTITNLGMFGVEEFSAIINPPESAILAVGAIREGIKVENGQIKPTRLMTLTLSSDHRVIDGVLSAKFLQTLKEFLENPQQLVD